MLGSPLLLILTLVLVDCAPRSKSSAATYDQKQTGEYNIQLHLKDFQIIAVLGDDSFPGDYDYNYDYSDFTIKPVTPSTTTRKPDESANSTTEAAPTLPSSIQSILTSISNNSSDKLTSNTTKAPSLSTVKPDTATATATGAVSTGAADGADADTAGADFLSNINLTSLLTPGQIPVIVQDFSLNSPLILRRNDITEKKNEAVTNVAIIPSEDGGDAQPETPALGEILHYRRCAQGYARDKRGRCRKIRRQPQMPLGFTRFANTLASRFRSVAAESSPDLP